MPNQKEKNKNIKNSNDNIIAKVWEFSYSGQKCVTIPKNSNIKVGEYVVISKIDILKIKKGDLIKIKRQ